MNENIVNKKEYNDFLFFHGICFDKKSDQVVFNDYGMTISDVLNTNMIRDFGKFSRYCVVGKYNYIDQVLELGISMIESPYPYVKKTARDIAINNLLNKTDFSLTITFEFLSAWLMYNLGNEVKIFNKVNYLLKNLRRGSLITLFKEKRTKRFIEEINKINK